MLGRVRVASQGLGGLPLVVEEVGYVIAHNLFFKPAIELMSIGGWLGIKGVVVNLIQVMNGATTGHAVGVKTLSV